LVNGVEIIRIPIYCIPSKIKPITILPDNAGNSENKELSN